MASQLEFSLRQDKNRDVIVAFPDVDPYSIPIPNQRYHRRGRPLSGRAILRENSLSFDQPHLWYSTSEVIRALELFLASGEELDGRQEHVQVARCFTSQPFETNVSCLIRLISLSCPQI